MSDLYRGLFMENKKCRDLYDVILNDKHVYVMSCYYFNKVVKLLYGNTEIIAHGNYELGT